MGVHWIFSQVGRNGLAGFAIASALLGPIARAQGVSAPECVQQAPAARVVTIPDPRSVATEDGRVLRVSGIESFALLHMAPAAADSALRSRLHALVKGLEVGVHALSERPDRYGRIPAILALQDGKTVQETLVAEGLAIAFATGPEIACFDRILAAEDEARGRARGFWADVSLPQAHPQALVPRIGRFAIFEGLVVSVGIRRSVTYLNFGGEWSQDVTVAIRGRDRDLFNGETDLAGMSGRRLRVRGFLEERAGPMMTVSSPLQIEVLEKAAERDGGGP